MDDHREHPLPLELDHWYGVTGLRYRQFLEALTALDLISARRHLDLFSRLLLGTLEASEWAFAEAGPDPRDDEDAELVRVDFMILRRSLQGLDDALDQLDRVAREQGPLRGAMVDLLDTFVRVDNIFARHHDRVQASLLPCLEAQLNRERSRVMAARLSASMQRAQPN